MCFKASHYTHSCSASHMRHIKRRVRCLLRATYCKGSLVPPRKQIAHKLSGTKVDLLGPKIVPRPLNKIVLIATDTSDCLYKQGSSHEVGFSAYHTVENHDLVLQETPGNSARYIPGWLNG